MSEIPLYGEEAWNNTHYENALQRSFSQTPHVAARAAAGTPSFEPLSDGKERAQAGTPRIFFSKPNSLNTHTLAQCWVYYRADSMRPQEQRLPQRKNKASALQCIPFGRGNPACHHQLHQKPVCTCATSPRPSEKATP